MLNKLIRFFIENKLVTVIVLLFFIGWGIVTAPFGWQSDILPRDPVPVDAIPNIGANQQIVFTEWPGRSPQDIEDQITYPLTTSLLGIPGVKTIRSTSVFGFSSIYIIFEEDIEFYWSRSRILEKLNSLSPGTLPEEVQPTLGPDATGLGQIFWYTLEGRDKSGNTTGGWDLDELRSIQDYFVRYGLASAQGVSEVASIGGYVKEYQIDVNPAAMKAHNITLGKVVRGVQESNKDIGARTIEINNAEYLVRGIGYVKNIEDIEQAVVGVNNNTPIRVRDIANVHLGPEPRRGILDKGGAEAVGGVVVARHGSNPLEVINNVKAKIQEIEEGLPQKTLDDGTVSQVKVVPFYDRTELIKETLGTLEEALNLEILITIIVVIVMVMNLRASLLISGLLPVAVLMTFIAMRYAGVEANIVALSGIAIAIGTMVDMAIVLSENMLRHLDDAPEDESKLEVIYRATSEVSTAVLTAVTTTIISFLPVFAMQAEEGKLFKPLAFTKTFALFAALVVALLIIPPLAHWLFSIKIDRKKIKTGANILLGILGIILIIFLKPWAGFVILGFSILNILEEQNFQSFKPEWFNYARIVILVFAVTWFLAKYWVPLGVEKSLFLNFIFVGLVIFVLLGFFKVIIYYYRPMLQWCLDHKKEFLIIPLLISVLGITIWMGFNTVFGFAAKGFDKVGWNIRTTQVWSGLAHTFPGIGEEFMPALDEGSFLLMPTTMPHAGVEKNKEIIQQLDKAVAAIPEVRSVVGKAGRVNSPLDPAPLSMYENIINYKNEYKTDENGKRIRFAVDENGEYLRDSTGNLIRDPDGQYYRQWRDHIESPDDIWNEIVKAAKIPGVTSAPKLQPIETRLVMLQTGMRAPMGLKISGPDLETIQSFGLKLEDILKEVPSIQSQTVYADRIVGKPYLHINIDRKAIARYGLTIEDVQRYISVAVGGKQLGTTVEGRERYPIRVRYPRELRDDPSSIRKILIPTSSGAQIPLAKIADLEYVKGPQAIKSENTFLIGYVTFGKVESKAEVEVVEEAKSYINEKIDNGELEVPTGVSYEFSGDYENQIRAEKRLSIVIPLALLIIFLVLYFQFRSVASTLMIFSGIVIAFAGGFILIWLYGQEWFMDFSFFGSNIRDLFQIETVNLSVAVWVGFIALFGIATDNGVVLATYLKQGFSKSVPHDKVEVKNRVIDAGMKRVRPCLMTTATTLLALLPVLSSTGKGAEIMVPMAIPSFGGMLLQLITLFLVPVLYSWWMERKMK